MHIRIRTILEPQCEIDITERLVAAIAEELWRLYGGSERLNWLEAERQLERVVRELRREREAAEAGPLDHPGEFAGWAQAVLEEAPTTRAEDAQCGAMEAGACAA